MSERVETTLGELIARGGSIKTGPFGTTLRANEYTASGVPVISVEEIGYRRLQISPKTPRVDATVTSRLAEYLLKEDDIVFARKGAVDRSALIMEPEAGWFLGSDGIRVRLSDESNPSFVSYQLSSRAIRAWILQHASGSTLLSLNQSTVERIPLLMPNLEAQDATAEVLGVLDDKIAANTRLADSAGRLATQIYNLEIKEVTLVSVNSSLAPILGGTPSRAKDEFWDGSNLWISARDVTGASHGVVLDTTEKITDLAVMTTKAKPIGVGSVVLTARGTVGAVARLGKPAAFNQSCYGFEPGGLPPSVLYLAISHIAEQAQRFVHGSVFDTITLKTFNHLMVPSFSKEEGVSLESRLRPLLDVVTESERENATLSNTRDALLPALMSGRLRVEEAERVVQELV